MVIGEKLYGLWQKPVCFHWRKCVCLILPFTVAWYYFINFIILFVIPIIWPIIISKVLKLEYFKGHIIHPIPQAWDWFFGKCKPYYVLIHLKNSHLIGGLYSENSYASAFPFKKDMYIEEVWKVKDNGEFDSKIEGTKGMWISKEDFDYIEFFIIGEEESNGKQGDTK
ncbi:MAG: DUF6338 family protein [Clostridiaceae bacterium]